MFGFFKTKKAEVMEHWYALVPGFNTSTKEFYAAVEAELKAREVPGLDIVRVDFAEGGVLSSKREYLRMTCERLMFDICAAPFGTAYFFSCRFVQIPATIKLWQLFVVCLVACLAVAVPMIVAVKYLGVIAAAILLFICLALVIYLLRNTVALGLQDLDAYLIKDPTFGGIYERFFRQETYYRQDTRLMYCDTVNAVVKAKVEAATGAKGIKLIRFNESSPILGELYKPSLVTPSQNHVPA